MNRLRRGWVKLGIARKFRLAFFLMVLVVLATAAGGYAMVAAVQREVEDAILTSIEIQQLALQMDGRLEKARRLQRDFFLRYPQIGFTQARQLYVDPALEQIHIAVSLSRTLRERITASGMHGALGQRNVNLDLYLSVAERYHDTLGEAVDLVTRLAGEQEGVLPRLDRQCAEIQDAITRTGNPEWARMIQEIHRYESEYLVSRRRSVMQSSVNVSTRLQLDIHLSESLSPQEEADLIALLQGRDSTAQQVVDLDSSIRSKLNDFDLQAQSVDPIAKELIQMADEQVVHAREEIQQTAHFATLTLLVIGVTGATLALLIADFLNLSVANNIVKLTRAARELEAGNLQTMVNIHSEDEFGNLAHAFNSMAGRLQGLFDSLQASEARYRGLFEDSPISLWEGDFSEINAMLTALSAVGVTDWRAYLRRHPEEIRRMVAELRVVSVNRATLDMLHCETKEDLLNGIQRIFTEKTWPALGEMLAAFASNRTASEVDSFLKDLDGNTRFVKVRANIVPGYEGNFARVLISVTDITEREQREQELRSIATVSAAMRTANSRAEMLPVIADQLTALLGAVGVALAVRDTATGEMRVELARGALAVLQADSDLPAAALGGFDGRAGEALAGPRPDLLRPVVYVPLVAQGSSIGTLWVSRDAALRPPETRILHAIADIAANAIHRATLFEATLQSAEDLSKAYEATIEGWSRALDLRDKETEGHTQRVTTLTLQLARSMGIDETGLVHIRRGALLHDIGKMGVPDEILRKPGPLDEKEWRVMRLHPELALKLLGPITYLHGAIDIPYCHHEKWDGSGYPRGLQGEEIPLAARIFSVVDVWDALLSDRPYRQSWSRERVIDYLREQAGHHFDPRIVETFIALQSQPIPVEGGLFISLPVGEKRI